MFLFSCGLAASPCVHTRVCSSPYLQVPLPLSRASIANVLNFSRKIFPVLQHSCILYVPRSVNLRFYTSAELGTINLSSKGSPAQPTSDESVTMQRANNLTYVEIFHQKSCFLCQNSKPSKRAYFFCIYQLKIVQN